jgi:quercetin dioxygenase-like cupin family protein
LALAMTGATSEQILEQGFAGPIRVLSAAQCRRFLEEINSERQPPPLDWDKGHATTSAAFYEMATYPPILDAVVAILGEDVMLWGASIQSRVPGAAHAWHTDIETSDPSGQTVSVWIGIENTNADTSLLLVPYSHRLGLTLQEARHERGKRRGDATDDEIVGWAQECDNRCRLVRTAVSDGEALFFEGGLWHSSLNVSDKTRTALLLQYASPRTQIRIPDLNYPDWPFRHISLPRPPCLLLRGSADENANRYVPAPLPASHELTTQSTSRIHPIRIPQPLDEGQSWKPYPTFNCSTSKLRTLTCHTSVLDHDCSPHPPHTHDEEELLLLLGGEVDVIIPDGPQSNSGARITPGWLAYYPFGFAHSLQTTSPEPANYLMLKWSSEAVHDHDPALLGHGLFDVLAVEGPPTRTREVSARLLFEGPTRYLRKLRCHVSTLAPGAGYEPHIDAHEVVIVVLEGRVETLEQRVEPHGVIFYRSGEAHGMHNPGDVTAKYVVFEFHGRSTPPKSESAAFAASSSPNVSPAPAPAQSRRLTSLPRRVVKRVSLAGRNVVTNVIRSNETR